MARQAERGEHRVAPRRGALVQRLNSPLAVAALTFVGYSAYLVARLALLGGDISRFVSASVHFIPQSSARAVGLSVLTHAYGYDGQFYYLLALDPFSAHAALAGAHFDLPAYRAQRILYPLVAWLLSLGGRPALVPWALVAVNLASIVAIGWLAALLARRLGVAPVWGLTLAFYPGLMLSLARDLAEPLALALALGAILCTLRAPRPRWGLAATLLSLAILTRETTALIAVALLCAGALAWLLRHQPASDGVGRWSRLRGALRMLPPEQWRGAALAGLSPLLVALGWQVVLLLHWGTFGLVAAGSNNIGLPLLGLFEGFVAWSVLWPFPVQLMQYDDVIYLLGLIEVTRRWLLRRDGGDYLALAWALYAAMTLCLSLFVWDYYFNFLRGAIEMALLSLLLLLGASPHVRRVALASTCALWLLAFVASVSIV